MKTFSRLAIISCCFMATQSYAFGVNDGYFALQVGGFLGTSGEEQDIAIPGLIGNQYTVTDGTDANAMFGLGYYFRGIDKDRFKLDYGLNAYYFFPMEVQGNIVQEHMFENLSYSYAITSLPILASMKTIFTDSSHVHGLTLDMGIGGNIIRTFDYDEKSKNSFTLTDHSYSGETTTALAAMAGIGYRMSSPDAPLGFEIGYRFFYLGEGQLESKLNESMSNLKTGGVFANALMLTITM